MNRYWPHTLIGLFTTLLLIVLQTRYFSGPPKMPPNAQIISPGRQTEIAPPSQPDRKLDKTSQTIGPGAGSLKLPTQPQAGGGASVFFCHWNVENLFDDRDDGRQGAGDKEYDGWLANNPDMLQLKLSKLTEALLRMNQGRGPDLLCVVEIESFRAAQLLQQALNARLNDATLHYHTVLFKQVSRGRHIAPAIITRLPVVPGSETQIATQQRTLLAKVLVHGHELAVIASHWTSRLKDSGVQGRQEYAKNIQQACAQLHAANPEVDIVVCGDFNDEPDDDSVRNILRAAGSASPLPGAGGPRLFNLLADKDRAVFGTHNYNGKWYLFDQIVVSPGMLDRKGWSVDAESLHTVNDLVKANDRAKRPWRFGSENDKGARGYSDHFPVTVRLHVAAPNVPLSPAGR